MRLIDAHKLTDHLQMVQKRDGLWGAIDRVVMEVIDRFVREEPTVDAASPWHRVEDGLPDDEVPVLAMLHNIYGRDVVLKLCHIGHHKRTTEDYGWQDYEGETEYDEENDCFWIPEGWWESNYHEDNLNWEIDETDGTITHWMPLPEPPKEVQDGE